MTSTIVIDNGSETIKVGFAGDDKPLVFCPSIIGKPRVNFKSGLKDYYIGDEANAKRGMLKLSYPIERGVITNWDDMEILWDNVFSNDLGISPKDCSLLLTDNPLNLKENREKMTQIMFEEFSVGALYISIGGVLSLFASNRTNGLVLESGDGVTHSIPVREGCAIYDGVLRSEVAGKDITDYLVKLLDKKGYFVRDSTGKLIVKDMKEVCGCVSMDLDTELKGTVSLGKCYELPDGNEVVLEGERFECTEALFKPNLIDGVKDDALGIHQMIFNSIKNCDDTEIRKDLYKNIVLSGGNTMFEGIVQRLQNELKKLENDVEMEVNATKDRKYKAWIGGSMLASTNALASMWVTKNEFEELGQQAGQSKWL